MSALDGAETVEEHLQSIELQAERGELAPTRASRSNPKAAARRKDSKAEQQSQELRRELQRAMKKQQAVASKLLEKRQRLDKKDSEL